MDEQVAVIALVHGPFVEQEADVLLELFGAAERLDHLVHHVLLFGRQGIGVFRVDGGEVAVLHRVDLAVDLDGGIFIVDVLEGGAVHHVEVRVALDDLAHQFEEDHGDGLGHAGRQQQIAVLRVLLLLLVEDAGGEARQVGEGIVLVREQRQRTKADAVADLEDREVIVKDGVRQDGGDADGGAGRGADPHDVVVAELDVEGMVLHQSVHDDVGAGATVEDVADEVEAIDDESFDDAADRDDEVLRLADLDDGVEDIIVIFFLIMKVEVDVDELIDDVSVLRGKGLTDFRTGILRGDDVRELDEVVEGLMVEGGLVVDVFQELLHLFFRVVDDGGEGVPLIDCQLIGEQAVDLFPDGTGGAVHDVDEGLVFAVDVRHEMFRGLRQVQDGVEVDDLGGGGLFRRVFFAEQPQALTYNTLQDLIDASKAAPETISFGISTGGGVYIAATILNANGLMCNFVDQGDANSRLVALLGGNSQVTDAPYATVKEYIEAGQVKSLCTLLGERPTLIPNIPTASETVPDCVINTLYACLAPKGTDPAIVEALNTAILDIITNDAEYAEECLAYNLQAPWALSVEDTVNELKNQRETFLKYLELF